MSIDREPSPVGQRIRRLRKQRDWSQNKLAREIETHPNVISRIELGIVKPDLETLEKIADAFRLGIADLLNGDPPKVATG